MRTIFCAEHGITSDIELIGIYKSTTPTKDIFKSDEKYHFFIDMASLRNAA
jgi:alcohol dehydrogenase (NADP+)